VGGDGGAIATTHGISAVNDTITSNLANNGQVGGAGGLGGGHNFCGGPNQSASGAFGNGGTGGAIAQLAGAGSLTNLTIAFNDAGRLGRRGLEISVSGGSLSEASTIVRTGSGSPACVGPITDDGFNLQFLDSTHPAFGCPGRHADPVLRALQNNGGPTQTMALGSGSAAIDSGPAYPIVCPATDQRGVTRPDSSEKACDIGAFEFEDVTFVSCSPCFTQGATPGPLLFGLRLHGNEKQGTEMIVKLRKPRVLVLRVLKITTHKLIPIGFVRLGNHPGGRSQFRWNLHVKGHLLSVGRYELILYAANGDSLSLPAQFKQLTLIVLKNGRMRLGH
jgi:hypothetical protein